MIEWIAKLPEPMIGGLVAGGLWFFFHYAVLAERAMEKDHASAVVPQCMTALDRQERARRISPSGLGTALGVPALDTLEATIIERAIPEFLTKVEKEERCACATKRAGQKLRFDYAVHTASFRIIEPQSLAGLGEDAVGIALSGTCGLLPTLKIGK
jgi:hypothetical protein